jgi:hypothetical protein
VERVDCGIWSVLANVDEAVAFGASRASVFADGDPLDDPVF